MTIEAPASELSRTLEGDLGMGAVASWHVQLDLEVFNRVTAPGTSTNVNVDQTNYLQVKACNSGGCSPYSSQVTAHYYNGCM